MHPLLKERHDFGETGPAPPDFYLENIALYPQTLGDELTSSGDGEEQFSALSAFVPPPVKQEEPLQREASIPQPLGDPAMTITEMATQRLVTNWYSEECSILGDLLSKTRASILSQELPHAEMLLVQFQHRCNDLFIEWDHLKSFCYLNIKGFTNLTALEDRLNVLIHQASLYEADLQQLQTPDAPTKVHVCLVILGQGGGPIFKDKTLAPFSIKFLSGATKLHIQTGAVQPEIVETHQQKIKKNNAEIEHSKQPFDTTDATATFSELKFSSGTFPHPVRLRFRAPYKVVINGQQVQSHVETLLSNPWISLTNTGSQWKDAAGTWLKEDCFREREFVYIHRFWNYLQKHFLLSTKQEDLDNIKRGLTLLDWDFMMKAKGLGVNGTIDQKDFQKFWDWMGPGLKKLKYQKHLLQLFCQGFIPGFINGQQAEETLKKHPPGTFLIRFSVRLEGEFVISYTSPTDRCSDTVRHYLVQPTDTAEKKQTLVDFLGCQPVFQNILQVINLETGNRAWHLHPKEKVLTKFYKKAPKVTTGRGPNPYDTTLG